MSSKIKDRIFDLLDDFHDGRIQADELMKQCLRLGARWQYGWQQDIATDAVDKYVAGRDSGGEQDRSGGDAA